MKTAFIIARELLTLYGWREGTIRIVRAAGQLIKAQFYPKAWKWKSRLAHCEKCDLFNKTLSTCGTPGESYFNHETQSFDSLGCWCKMREAARLPKKDCWARANGMDFGWPKNLRPKP